MKALKNFSIIVFFVFAMVSCQDRPVADDDYPIEDIKQEEVETMAYEFKSVLGAELIDEPVYTDVSVSYSFELPYEIENMGLIRITITSIVLSQFDRDISEIWEVGIDGVHYTNFVYKGTNVKLAIDPETNVFCLEFTRT